MTCQEAVNKLYEYIDSELDRATTEKIKKHLDLCRLCCDQFEFEKTMKELVHKCCDAAKAPDVLKEKILKSLNP
ncbi:MAG: mycothiol system anti-sigma-R factor [Candidatus Zixiibacteriota bacterium]|nr:MAG: mycothiol system anti-sigma-R factor [candidate division Zixibacteria bacterium]